MRSHLCTVGVLCAVLVPLAGCQSTANMSMNETTWGEHDGHAVRSFELDNGCGLAARLTNYGATLTELYVPDRNGVAADVVLGFDDLAGYLDRSSYFGATCGRVANRIANGRFEIDGRVYTLATNNGPHHLHGGVAGFDKVVWDAAPIETKNAVGVRFTLRSPDGDEGYPGAVVATTAYMLTQDNELVIEMSATCDAPTPVNLAHHSYWNLAGHDAATIHDHVLQLDADRYTPADATLIPTGAIEPVAGTPYDFRQPKRIGAGLAQLPPSGADPGGYDLNYVVNGEATDDAPRPLLRAAVLTDPASGRTMEVWSTMPGVQFYTGNYLNAIAGKGGAVYPKHGGLCLETQFYPDAVNKRGVSGWPNPVLQPGATYRHRMVHRFR